MSELLVVSPCFYHTAEPADLMLKSAQAHGLQVLVYGVKLPFIPHGADAQVAKLYDLMCQVTGHKYILVTDCRDVLFLADQEEIMGKFHSFSAPLVMSAEQGCWPPDQEIAEFYYGKDPNGYNFVNAGQYIGEWAYVRNCLKILLDKYRGVHPGADNSQGWWMWAKMRGELDFALDSGCQIFQSMSGGGETELTYIHGSRPHRVLNMHTASIPCTLHFNGNPGNDKPQQEMYRRLFQ